MKTRESPMSYASELQAQGNRMTDFTDYLDTDIASGDRSERYPLKNNLANSIGHEEVIRNEKIVRSRPEEVISP
jgi:hypothetical protein